MSLSHAREIAAPLSATARAKINLTLRVTGRRADGYHLLESLVVFADLGDRLSARVPEAGEPGLSLALEGPFAPALAAQGSEADNLVLRAARRLAESAGTPSLARFTLDKRLPVASGIGGGSADAAAALHLLNRLWALDRPLAELQALALPLGADIPVCLFGQPAVMRGIGEEIAPLSGLPPFALVLANPGAALSTGAIFAARADRQGGSYSAPSELPAGFTDFEALRDWLSAQANDLEAPALSIGPVIGEVLEALGRTEGCGLARMSGSGATCFGLYATVGEAEAAADALKRAYPNWWVAASPAAHTTAADARL